MHPDRLLLGLPSVHPLSVSAGPRFSLWVIISATSDVGWGLSGEGPVGLWEKKVHWIHRPHDKFLGKEYIELCMYFGMNL